MNKMLHTCTFAALLVLCACSGKETPQGADEHLVPVQLAFAMEQGIGTKANATTITELASTPQFGGMEDIRILAFSRRDSVLAEDTALGHLRTLPAISSSSDNAAVSGYSWHEGLIRTNRAHLFSDAFAALPRGTGSVLIYGTAPRHIDASEAATKHLNGSIVTEGLESGDFNNPADGIFFSPEPIYSGNTPAAATGITEILTRLVGSATYTKEYYYQRGGVWNHTHIDVSWNENTEDDILREYFNWFTNNGQLMPGSGSSAETLLTSLYNYLRGYVNYESDVYMHVVGGEEYEAVETEGGTDTFTYATLYNGLRSMLLARFDALFNENILFIASGGTVSFVSPNLRNYPVGIGLPPGAATMRWNGLKYVPVVSGLDGIAPLDRFCYMPPMMYMVNSTISTSADAQIQDIYTSDRTWEQIHSQYRLGKAVTQGTRAVAVDYPMQYACGMLAVTVTATSPVIPDNDGNPRTNCSATGTNFPVTGIILGGQFKQDYTFNPVSSAPEYYLYDNQVSGVYLTNTKSAEFRTLVLPSMQNTDVYFYIEMRNDSGATFTGQEGLILPGNYFYLAGQLSDAASQGFDRIFMRDHYTEVNCTVSSFEHAHVCVPELGEPQLTLGVQTKTSWVMSASSYIVME
ncbi:MAG: hypothetical protein IKZ91_01500 [Bacteroidales bacterium]|nr:hypothetical protein [Bacteroidales bacterium]